MQRRNASRLGGAATRASVGVVLALVIAACTPTPGPATINTFSADQSSGPAPLTTAFTWNISGTDLTCGLDLDGNGTYEITITACTSASVRSATFDTPGTHTVRLQVSDDTTTVTSDPVDLTVGAPSADTYDVTVRFAGTPTPSQQAAFTSAGARWSDIVKTGLSDVPLNLLPNICGTGAPGFSGTVDDLLIDAAIDTIDGPGGILAQAGPCFVRIGGLPVYGVMKFDSADIASLEAGGQFEDVILHEMGHVLGFGTVWGFNLAGGGTANSRFTGLTARGAWDALAGGSGVSVPVETTGGPGTADAHWRESVFDNELMTGYINNGANPLSAVTVASLADIGYGVDLDAADSFGAPALTDPSSPSTQIRTELIYPIGQVPG